ncbi:MAG: phosphoadenylyl-sulfate reductase [Verrucomicrobiae bacterium]
MSPFDPELIRRKAQEFESAALPDILRWAWEAFGRRAAIGTSFQGAGLVAMHAAYTNGFRFPVFTIDTGMLFPQTLELKSKIEELFGIGIESLASEQTIGEQAEELGPELWKTKPDLCCALRKVIPLQKKLAGLDVWITGLRRQQGTSRDGVKIIELYHFDVLRDRYIIKLNPMSNWTREQVNRYLSEHSLPANALAALGYRSIGCQPCTRPVSDGDDERAGRWTGFDKSECGIHTFLGSNI